MSGTISTHTDGAVARVVIDNPARRNAIGYAMWRSLAETLGELEADGAVRTVLLTGAGEAAFSAGADIKEFDEWRTTPEREAEYSATAAAATDALAQLSKPVVVAVRGVCIGGGFELALLGDIRVCSEDASFAVTPARLGLGYDLHDTALLVSRLGPQATREILLTGRRFQADEALRLGIVSRVAPPRELDTVVDEYLAMLAANAPLTMRASKFIVAEAAKSAAERDVARCEALVAECYASNDYAEGRAAFAERRQPRFEGR